MMEEIWWMTILEYNFMGGSSCGYGILEDDFNNEVYGDFS